MNSLTMDMVQYDCPFIDTTTDHEISFKTVHWDFDTRERKLETRMVVESPDRYALENGLEALWEHPNMHDYRLLLKRNGEALIKTVIAQTNAMKVIRNKGGFITGPFEIRDGSEIWRVGFDTNEVTDETLSKLDKKNDFDVEEHISVAPEDFFDLLQNMEAAKTLMDGCRDISPVEKTTIEAAVKEGYYENPREANLSTLADEFDVSKTAVSKNLRRGEQKLLTKAIDAISEMD